MISIIFGRINAEVVAAITSRKREARKGKGAFTSGGPTFVGNPWNLLDASGATRISVLDGSRYIGPRGVVDTFCSAELLDEMGVKRITRVLG